MSNKRNQEKQKNTDNQNLSQKHIVQEESDNIVSIESCKYIYELVNGWIENADNKVSVSCGVFTGVFGVLTFLSENSIKIPDNPIINEFWHYLYWGSLILSIMVMLCAVYFYTKAIIPNLNSNEEDIKKKKYPIYYGDISSLDYKQYKKLMENGSIQDFKEELMHDSWFNSGICIKKMKRYRIGVKLSFIAIILAFISLIFHIFMYR